METDRTCREREDDLETHVSPDVVCHHAAMHEQNDQRLRGEFFGAIASDDAIEYDKNGIITGAAAGRDREDLNHIYNEAHSLGMGKAEDRRFGPLSVMTKRKYGQKPAELAGAVPTATEYTGTTKRATHRGGCGARSALRKQIRCS